MFFQSVILSFMTFILKHFLFRFFYTDSTSKSLSKSLNEKMKLKLEQKVLKKSVYVAVLLLTTGGHTEPVPVFLQRSHVRYWHAAILWSEVIFLLNNRLGGASCCQNMKVIVKCLKRAYLCCWPINVWMNSSSGLTDSFLAPKENIKNDQLMQIWEFKSI